MFKIKQSLCTECQICMSICSWFHFGEATVKRSRIQVDGEWPSQPDILLCLACKNHECITACPHEALSWENWIRLDPQKCDSCGACVEACPVNGVHMDPSTELPLICDTCAGEFQCVQWCPTRAIERKPAS